MSTYTATLTEEQLEQVRSILGPIPARRVAARKAPAVDVFEPNTGDARLDAFMRAHHKPGWTPPPKVGRAPAFPFGLPKRLSSADRRGIAEFNDAAVKAWRANGFDVIITRVEGSVEGVVALDGRNVRMVRR